MIAPRFISAIANVVLAVDYAGAQSQNGFVAEIGLEPIMLQTAVNKSDFADFMFKTQIDDIPQDVIKRCQDYVLDLIGVSAASTNIEASRLGREMAVRMFAAGAEDAKARILFDGRTASLSDAAYAGANQIDSLDAHDGYSPAKGHAGCGLLPGVLAFAEQLPDLTGRAAR